MAQTVEDLLVRIDASTEQLRREMRRADQTVQQSSTRMNRALQRVDGAFRRINNVTRGLGGQLAAALSVGVLTRFGGQALQTAEQVQRMSMALGTSMQTMQELTFTFRQFGLDQNDVTDALGTLSDRAQDAVDGMESMADDFRLIGVEIDDLRGKRPEELFRLMADRVSEVQDPTLRTAAIVRTFGDDLGRRLLPLLMEGSRGLDGYSQAARNAGAVMRDELIDEQVEALRNFRELKEEVSADFARTIGENAAQLQNVAAGLANIAEFGIQAAAKLNDVGVALGRALIDFAEGSGGSFTNRLREETQALIDEQEALTLRIEQTQRRIADYPEDHPAVEGFRTRLQDMQRDLRNITAVIERRQRRLGNEVAELNEATTAWFANFITGMEDMPPALAVVEAGIRKVEEASSDTADKVDDVGESAKTTWQEMLGGIDPAFQATQTLAQELQTIDELNERIGLSSIERARLEGLARDRYVESIESIYDVGDATDEVTARTEDAVQQVSVFAQEWENALEGIQRNLADTFEEAMQDGLDSFSDVTDRMIDVFRNMLAEMAAAAVMNPIRVAIGMDGTLGGAGGSLAGDALGGIGNQVGSALGFSSGGVMGSGTAAVGHPAGGMAANSTFTGASGVGALASGAAIAGMTAFIASQAFEGRRDSEWFRLLSGTPGSASGDPLGNIRGATQVGTAFDPRDLSRDPLASRNTPFGRIAISGQNDFAGDADARAQEVVAAFASIDTTIAQALGEDLVDQIVNDGVLEGVLIASGKAFSDGGGSYSTEDAMREVVTERVAMILDAVDGAAGDAVRGFAQGAPGRDWEGNRIFTDQPSAEQVSRFGAGVASLSGFSQSSVSVPEQQTLNDTFRDQADAVRNLIDSYDGSLEATEELASATQQARSLELQMLEQINAASQAIENQLGSTIEMIRRDLMDTEQEYDFLRSQAESLAAGLSDITDPQRLQEEVARIDRLTREAYGILDEAQREAMGPGFLDFLGAVEQQAQDQLRELRSDVGGEGRSLRDDISGVINDLAGRLMESADKNVQAAEINLQASQNNLDASNRPVQVQVAGSGQEVGFGVGR